MTLDDSPVGYATLYVSGESRWNIGHVGITNLVEVPAGNHTLEVDWRMGPQNPGDLLTCQLGEHPNRPCTHSLVAMELSNS